MCRKESLADRFQGLLVGTAVGDSLGLPREGLSAERAQRLLGPPGRHAFVLGRGMVSDDTEHSVLVAQSLIRHPSSAGCFAHRLAWGLRWWLLALPAGIGLATLRSILRLWLGFPVDRAGVFSAGNGAAMRSAPIGAFFADDPQALDEYVSISSRLTHTDPRAEIGARAVAMLAAHSVCSSPSERPAAVDLQRILQEAHLPDRPCAEWDRITAAVRRAVDHHLTVAGFAESLGCRDGVSGYVFHTVPLAVYAWYHHYGDFRTALESVLLCGGDTDTTGAIIGALAGATVGVAGIPDSWVDGIADWPRGVGLLTDLGARLAAVAESGQPGRPVRYLWPVVIPRNIIFLLLVLAHGLRRLLPPY